MIEPDPKIVNSRLSRTVTMNGITVQVWIIRLKSETEWSLEVVNSANVSIIWDDLFPSDTEAFAEFQRTVAEEGMRTFLDNGNGIPLFKQTAAEKGMRSFPDKGNVIPSLADCAQNPQRSKSCADDRHPARPQPVCAMRNVWSKDAAGLRPTASIPIPMVPR